ncbi:MAG: hypothetical protein MUE79_02810 [Nitratireductor sp.]|jgi:hypothetical protein|nr:hypothetical protein [Nitratireductor sp.]
MQMFELAAMAGAAGFVIFAISLALSSTSRRGTWRLPAALCVAFVVFSAYAVATEGPTGFWPVHSQSAWGNQVWFDLLLAGGVALAFLVPEARRQGMNPVPWTLLVILTGSIGLLAMTARIMHLKEGSTAPSGPEGAAAAMR